MLFQGQEFASSRPFLLLRRSESGARALDPRRSRGIPVAIPQHAARADAQACLANPADPETFARCKLDFAERATHGGLYALHRDLLRLRREDRVIGQQRRGAVDGAVLGPAAFVLRYFGTAGDDRVLVVNLGADLWLSPAPEPLLGPTGRLLLAVALVERRSGLRRFGDSSPGNRRELDDPRPLSLCAGSPERTASSGRLPARSKSRTGGRQARKWR